MAPPFFPQIFVLLFDTMNALVTKRIPVLNSTCSVVEMDIPFILIVCYVCCFLSSSGLNEFFKLLCLIVYDETNRKGEYLN